VDIGLTIVESPEGAAVSAKRVPETEAETDLARQQRGRHARTATPSTTHESAKLYCECSIGWQYLQTCSLRPSGTSDPCFGRQYHSNTLVACRQALLECFIDLPENQAPEPCFSERRLKNRLCLNQQSKFTPLTFLEQFTLSSAPSWRHLSPVFWPWTYSS